MPAPTRTHRPTPGQTVGPFFAYGLAYPGMSEIALPHSSGAILLHGTVRDGAGDPIPDALVEVLGADADGVVHRTRGASRNDVPTFTGFGRAFTDEEGHYEFWTRDPGATEGRAPFFAAIIFARGLPDKLHTRIYLPENTAALARDPLLASLDPEERRTLIATRMPDGSVVHDIRLQGDGETVFLSYSPRGGGR